MQIVNVKENWLACCAYLYNVQTLSVHWELEGTQPGFAPMVSEQFLFGIALDPKLQVCSAPRLCCDKGTCDAASGKETTPLEECTKKTLVQ